MKTDAVTYKNTESKRMDSPLVEYVSLSPNHSGQRTHGIDRITPHCAGGQFTVSGIGDWFSHESVKASSNYGIDRDGRVGMYVMEENRSWCSSNSENDQRAVTIECASEKRDPYGMNDAVYLSLIRLCTEICRRNGKRKLLWLEDREKTLNYDPAPDEMLITVHRWFTDTFCPGDWLYSRLGDLAEKVTASLSCQGVTDAAYDYLIVGAGLFGAACARLLTDAGKKVLIVEKRDHIGGNVYTEEIEGIRVHKYGAHIFHTNDRGVWEFLGRFAEFSRYTHAPAANYRGEIFSLPFNMYTFNRIWGVVTPEEAKNKILTERVESGITSPKNLEEQALSLMGRELFEKLIKGDMEKQWGRPCGCLPTAILKRIPIRFSYDNRYFSDAFQGIPEDGYTKMAERMIDGIDCRTGVDYLEHRTELDLLAKRIIYTGPIDAFYGYCFGALQYRSLRFETEVLDIHDFQGNSVVNYTDAETPWTRIIEHKWFGSGKDASGKELNKTVITREYPREWEPGEEPYYPVNDEKNDALYRRYAALAMQEENVFFGGRLGEYRYYDMDQTVAAAMRLAEKLQTEI